MEIKGKVVQVLPTQTGISSNGKDWKKSSVVINYKEGNYEKTVCIVTMNKVAELAQSLRVGQEAEFSISLSSREYNGKWYSDINAWKIEAGQGGAVVTDNDGLPF